MKKYTKKDIKLGSSWVHKAFKQIQVKVIKLFTKSVQYQFINHKDDFVIGSAMTIDFDTFLRFYETYYTVEGFEV